jgi:hypothetical protein
VSLNGLLLNRYKIYKARGIRDFRHKKDALRRLDLLSMVPKEGLEQSPTTLGTKAFLK